MRPPARSYRYSVTGRGPFPHDMLRYDEAFVTGEDNTDTTDARRTVTLRSKQPPTEARWSSFMWRVESVVRS